METCDKEELYKIIDIIQILNNRVVKLVEKVNNKSSNNKYKLPVINKTKTQTKPKPKRERGIILKKNVLRDYWTKESEWIQFIAYCDSDISKRLFQVYNEYRKTLCLENVKFHGFAKKYLKRDERIKLISYLYENSSHNIIYFYDILLAIKKTQSREKKKNNVLMIMR